MAGRAGVTYELKYVIGNQLVRGDFLTQISWGTIGLCGVLFGSQNNLGFRTLEVIVPSHSFAKNHSSFTDCLLRISYVLSLQAKSVYLGYDE